MKKTDFEAVEKVLSLNQQMNTLTVDKINDSAPEPEETEPQVKLSLKEIAKLENIPYIEPTSQLGAFGKLPEKLRKQHERDWEYVKGMLENNVSPGQYVDFWYSIYPGDPDCYWIVPANRVCYVPRMIATHLEKAMKFHQFDYVEKPSNTWRKDDYQQELITTSTHYRAKFRAIGAFA